MSSTPNNPVLLSVQELQAQGLQVHEIDGPHPGVAAPYCFLLDSNGEVLRTLLFPEPDFTQAGLACQEAIHFLPTLRQAACRKSDKSLSR